MQSPPFFLSQERKKKQKERSITTFLKKTSNKKKKPESLACYNRKKNLHKLFASFWGKKSYFLTVQIKLVLTTQLTTTG